MTSPVSFGDAVAMAKIAWKIAQAFTKGSRSAPAEFREVENQLYSLSAALTAFKDICGTDIAAMAIDPAKLPPRLQKEEQDAVRTVSGILDNCNETLKHLEKIVEQYGVVAIPTDLSQPRLKRWSTGLVKNYKKIAWTTEAGDLAALRSQLMVHTNSLDLVLGIVVSSRTSRIEDSLKENSDMIKEIHSWWVQNLRDASTAKSEPVQMGQSLGVQSAPDPISFKVYLTTDGVPELLCPKACLHDDWKEPESPRLLSCRCNLTRVADSDSGHPRVEKIALSPFCFPFRQAGDSGSWTLFKALDQSTSRMISILIKDIAASDIREFEESFIRPLAEARAATMLQHGISNMLVHLSPDAQHLRGLNIRSDLKNLHHLVDTVCFHVGHRNLSRPDVEGLSLLNYRDLDRERHEHGRGMKPGLDHAELAIYYGSLGTGERADVTRSVIHLRHDASLQVREIDACVVVGGVECLGFVQEEQVNQLDKADVVFHMTSLEAARKLYQKVEDMRMELFVMSLQYPLRDEVVVLHLQATEVQCEVAFISDAELLITRRRESTYRLIVASRNRCTVLTQVLPDSFFTSYSPQAPNFTSSTWLVQLEGSGQRKVYHYPNGFRFLSFRNANAERMFELGRTALLQGASNQTLPMRERFGE